MLEFGRNSDGIPAEFHRYVPRMCGYIRTSRIRRQDWTVQKR